MAVKRRLVQIGQAAFLVFAALWMLVALVAFVLVVTK